MSSNDLVLHCNKIMKRIPYQKIWYKQHDLIDELIVDIAIVLACVNAQERGLINYPDNKEHTLIPFLKGNLPCGFYEYEDIFPVLEYWSFDNICDFESYNDNKEFIGNAKNNLDAYLNQLLDTVIDLHTNKLNHKFLGDLEDCIRYHVSDIA